MDKPSSSFVIIPIYLIQYWWCCIVNVNKRNLALHSSTMPKNKEKNSNGKVTKSPTKKQRSLPEESEWAVVVAPGSWAGGLGGEKGGERGRRTGKQRSLDLNMATADRDPPASARQHKQQQRGTPASAPQNKQQRGAPTIRAGGGGGNGPADPSTPTSRRPRRQRPRVDSGGNTDPPSPAVSPPGGQLLVHRHYDSAHSQERDSTTTTTTTSTTTMDQHKHHHHTSVSTSLQHYSHPQSLFFFHCRNLANHLYSKVYETQEDLCRKRNEIRLANLQLAAVRAQVSTLLYAIDLLVLFHGVEYRCVTATVATTNMTSP